MTQKSTERYITIENVCAALVLALLLFVVSCHSTEEPTPSATNTDGPDQEGWNSKITVTSTGQIAAHVQYGHMAKYSKKQQTQFDGGIEVDFYNRAGEHTSHLTADKGLLFEDTNDVEARENVIAKSDSGITLFTQILRWQNRMQKIVTDDFVTIATPKGDTLRGKGFESDQNLKNYLIKQPTGVTQKKFELPKNTRKTTKQAPDSSDENKN